MVTVDGEHMYLVSGNGDVIEPDKDVVGIGSGSVPAQAAALALMEHSTLDAADIAREAMRIAATYCIYTNTQVTLEEL